MINEDVALAAYHEMFDNTVFEKYLTPKNKYSSYEVVGIDETVQYNTSTVSCYFAKPERLIPNMNYDYTCSMKFRYVENETIDKLFENKIYDYTYVKNVFKALNEIGERYGFVKEVKVKDFSVEGSFKSRMIEKNSSFKPAGVVTLSNALVQFDPDYKKMVYACTINIELLFIVKDNRLNPVLIVSYPVSAKKRYYLYLNIHLANECNQVKELLVFKNDYELKVKEHMDDLLKNNFKMNISDINQLTIEDKIDYMKIIEMGSI